MPLAEEPPEVGVIGITTFPSVDIDNEVSLPYGTSALYMPLPYGCAQLIDGISGNDSAVKAAIIMSVFFVTLMLL